MSIPELWRELQDFWFGELSAGYPREPRDTLWFGGGAALDADIRRRFGDAVDAAIDGAFADWEGDARGELALVLLLDQLPRNIHRGSARAFAGDERARRIVDAALAAGRDRELAPIERAFFYLPLEHSEQRADLERCVALFEQLLAEAPPEQRAAAASRLDYAVRHRAVIERFGRYPYRNAVLGRPSTDQELSWLEQGERFGQ